MGERKSNNAVSPQRKRKGFLDNVEGWKRGKETNLPKKGLDFNGGGGGNRRSRITHFPNTQNKRKSRKKGSQVRVGGKGGYHGGRTGEKKKSKNRKIKKKVKKIGCLGR